jgi:hypothetical protein
MCRQRGCVEYLAREPNRAVRSNTRGQGLALVSATQTDWPIGELGEDRRTAGLARLSNNNAWLGSWLSPHDLHQPPPFQSRKSDLVGGEVYLERWTQFLSDHDPDLLKIGTEAGLLVDRATSVAVAEWSYGHAERVQAEVWLGGTDYGHLSEGWRRLLHSTLSSSDSSM